MVIVKRISTVAKLVNSMPKPAKFWRRNQSA